MRISVSSSTVRMLHIPEEVQAADDHWLGCYTAGHSLEEGIVEGIQNAREVDKEVDEIGLGELACYDREPDLRRIDLGSLTAVDFSIALVGELRFWLL